jgi:hypothetical protein
MVLVFVAIYFHPLRQVAWKHAADRLHDLVTEISW